MDQQKQQNQGQGAQRRDITASTQNEGNMGNLNEDERGRVENQERQERNRGGISNRESDEYVDIDTDTDTDVDVDADLDNVGGTE